MPIPQCALLHIQYNYSADNNRRIASATAVINNETVNYTYDALNRPYGGKGTRAPECAMSVSQFLMSLTSRRRFLGMGVWALGSARVVQSPATTPGIRFGLAKVFKNGTYGAVSPDSQLLCFSCTERPVGTLVLGASGERRNLAYKGAEPNFQLKVVEIGSWKEIYSERIQGLFGSFSFFEDGFTLFGQASTAKAPITIRRFVVNLQTGDVTERQAQYDSASAMHYSALRDATLVGIGIDRGLVKVVWPDFREEVQVRAEGGAGTFRLSNDRRLVVDLEGQELVCPRVVDFAVLWRRPIDASIGLTQQWNDRPTGPHVSSAAYAISSDGNRVVQSPWADTYHGQPERFYTEHFGKKLIQITNGYANGVVTDRQETMRSMGGNGTFYRRGGTIRMGRSRR